MEKATREQTKFHNTRLVLKTIYEQCDVSRAEVARITHLTRTTVSDIVSELISEGLLVETGVGFSAGGKPPIILKLQEDARQLICLDLSGTHCAGAVVNLRGKILQREEISYETEGPGQAQAAVQNVIQHLMAHASSPVIGIGIGVPGLTDPTSGVVRRAVHLEWSDLPLKHMLENQYHLPVYLSNDSHAAALAEFTFGQMRGSSNLIVVHIGEGIGSGILLSGQIHYGDGYGAGEIGHLTVVEGGRLCTCGNYGCLETVASPEAILQRVRELAEYDWVSFAKEGITQPKEIDWNFVRRLFAAGDETITELIKEAGRYLGISIANLVSILNVRRIVISGCYEEFGNIFLDAVRGEVQRRALRTTVEETQIVHSSLGRDIIILGVTALVLSHEMGLP